MGGAGQAASSAVPVLWESETGHVCEVLSWARCPTPTWLGNMTWLDLLMDVPRARNSGGHGTSGPQGRSASHWLWAPQPGRPDTYLGA